MEVKDDTESLPAWDTTDDDTSLPSLGQIAAQTQDFTEKIEKEKSEDEVFSSEDGSDSEHNLLTPPQSDSPDLSSHVTREWPERDYGVFTPPPPPPVQSSPYQSFDYNDYQPRLSTPSGSSDSPKHDRASPRESKLGIGYKNIQQSVQQENRNLENNRPFNPTPGSRASYSNYHSADRGYYR